MKKFKKILVFLVLMVGCCCCFASCSCSSASPPDPEVPPTVEQPTEPGLQEQTYYNVSVTVTGDEGSGTFVSSTGNNRHLSASSPVYTFTPTVGYAIETITLDGAIYYTHLVSGYKKEAMEVTIPNISKNYTLGVTFTHMDYAVECTVKGEVFGGAVVSSTGGDTHKGATSPTYTISPNNGYCIYSLKVDGSTIYDYESQFATDQEGATKTYVIDEPFEVINDNHAIEVTFSKLFDVTEELVSASYTKESGNSVVTDTENLIIAGFDVVTFDELENYTRLPIGMAQDIKLNINPQVFNTFESVALKVSIDGGETYSGAFSLTEDFEDAERKVVYHANTNTFEFGEFSDKVLISVVGVPRKVFLTLYNFDNEEIVNTIETTLFNYKEGVNNSYHWYYTLDANSYNLSNTYISVNVEMYETASGGELYRIFLDESMLCRDTSENYIDKIILIYSSTDLKK